MYQPAHFREERPDVLRELVARHPLGALVTLGPGSIEGNHVPFLYDPDPAPLGTLRAHVARANPVWREFAPDVEALVIFQGPQANVSPSWYPRKWKVSQNQPPAGRAGVVRGRSGRSEDRRLGASREQAVKNGEVGPQNAD